MIVGSMRVEVDYRPSSVSMSSSSKSALAASAVPMLGIVSC